MESNRLVKNLCVPVRCGGCQRKGQTEEEMDRWSEGDFERGFDFQRVKGVRGREKGGTMWYGG